MLTQARLVYNYNIHPPTRHKQEKKKISQLATDTFELRTSFVSFGNFSPFAEGSYILSLHGSLQGSLHGSLLYLFIY